MPFTLDGGGLPDYPNPAYDLRLAKKLNVKSTPAIYLVNPSKGKVHPIAFSLISLLELEERIYKLLFTTLHYAILSLLLTVSFLLSVLSKHSMKKFS